MYKDWFVGILADWYWARNTQIMPKSTSISRWGLKTCGSSPTQNVVILMKLMFEPIIKLSNVMVTGTTWTQEMVWMIAHDCDTEAAKESLITRSPFIEYKLRFFFFCSFLVNCEAHFHSSSADCQTLPKSRWSPKKKTFWNRWRWIKLGKCHHLEWSKHIYLFICCLLTWSTRARSTQLIKHLTLSWSVWIYCGQVVYVARNPKDVIVSYFHHHKLFTNQQFTADIEKFADYFMKDECKH